MLLIYKQNSKCWGNIYSNNVSASNGVRQGDKVSPFLFNLYMDELSAILDKADIGCVIGNQKINHLLYADDIVLFSPSVRGLQGLFDITTE
jgi:hypothetical protein